MRRILFAAAGIAVVAAAVVVAVVAASAALFHTLEDTLGTALAYGVVAAAAVVVAIVAVAAGGLKAPRRKPEPEPTLAETLGKIARERPILSAGAALAAGIVALKNPSIVGAVLTSFLAGRSQGRDSRRR
jgi:hypothetical protein